MRHRLLIGRLGFAPDILASNGAVVFRAGTGIGGRSYILAELRPCGTGDGIGISLGLLCAASILYLVRPRALGQAEAPVRLCHCGCVTASDVGRRGWIWSFRHGARWASLHNVNRAGRATAQQCHPSRLTSDGLCLTDDERHVPVWNMMVAVVRHRLAVARVGEGFWPVSSVGSWQLVCCVMGQATVRQDRLAWGAKLGWRLLPHCRDGAVEAWRMCRAQGAGCCPWNLCFCILYSVFCTKYVCT